MEKYELKIFPSAEQDLRDVINYLNELSPQAALKIYDEIVDSIASLEQMPLRCSLAKNTVLRSKKYRLLIVQNYVVFFIVSGNIVQIRRILYGRRQYEFLL
ncbi:RelE/StbE family addiction module toxin [Desulfosporosinus sp. Tol-M]|jgi:Plasmid stabilization system protein|nr:RelE/StbE family addiction module toxin [Desulfosporosinus sp. Tol-M]